MQSAAIGGPQGLPPRRDAVVGIGHNFTRAITMMPISEVHLHPESTRLYSRGQRRSLSRFAKHHPDQVPIGIDDQGRVVIGEAFFVGAQQAGLETIPTFLVTGLTDLECEALAAGYANAARQGSFDFIKLGGLFERLEIATIDPIDLGFEVPQIDIAFTAASADKAEAGESEAETPPGPPVTRLGDLFLLGKHRLICGDALDREVLALLMNGRRAVVMFTDPPYNVPIDGFVSGKGKRRHREFAMGVGEMSVAEFTQFLRRIAENAINVSQDGALHMICMDWRHARELLDAASVYGAFINLCVWKKDRAGMGSYLRSQHELIFIFKVGKAPHINNVQLGKHGRDRTNIWEYPAAATFLAREEDGALAAQHVTPKPVKMVADALQDCSARDDIVLELFSGSGTTIIAAERTGRACFAVELDPLYVDLAVRRWEAWTGETAIHEQSGMNFAELAVARLKETNCG